MRCKFIAWAAVALIGAAPFAGARADVLFDSITGNTPTGSDPVLAVTSGGSAGPLGNSFSTGAQGVYLPAVTLTLELNASTPGDLGSIQISLWSDGGGTNGPSTELAAFNSIEDSQLSSSAYSLISVSSSQDIALAANTRYWIELTSTDSSASLAYGADSGIGVSSEYFLNQYSSPLVTSNAGGPYLMSVAVVPEPASVGLLAFGAFALAGFTRRRRDALADGVPSRDVLLSHDHRLFVLFG